MSNRISRIETIEKRFGFDNAPCAVCGHRAGGNRCERPEDVAELNERFNEAMKEHMAQSDKMRYKLMELGVDWK